MEGTVKWYNKKKGYGFIQGSDGVDYFVHHSAIVGGAFIRENDKVSFETADTEKGKQAKDVTLLQKGSERSDVVQREPRGPARREEAALKQESEAESSEEGSGGYTGEEENYGGSDEEEF